MRITLDLDLECSRANTGHEESRDEEKLQRKARLGQNGASGLTQEPGVLLMLNGAEESHSLVSVSGTTLGLHGKLPLGKRHTGLH